jgi:hypothetical protein
MACYFPFMLPISYEQEHKIGATNNNITLVDWVLVSPPLPKMSLAYLDSR